jgi:serine protease
MTPSTWYGSHVAGTIAAATDNGIGVSGIDGSAKLVPVRVLGACGGNDADIIDGIYWAVGGKKVRGAEPNPFPAQIVNMSLGGDGEGRLCRSQGGGAMTERMRDQARTPDGSMNDSGCFSS